MPVIRQTPVRRRKLSEGAYQVLHQQVQESSTSTVAELCKGAGISRQAYYAWVRKQKAPGDKPEAQGD